MGIPSYFAWLVRHFKKEIITKECPFPIVHQLYLDFNCAIHPVARSHPEYTPQQMCDQIVIYLDYLIKFAKPTELIYLAIDGVAPVAKMKQQRIRRFKSVQETAEINKLKEQWGIPHASGSDTDFNMISPATSFMKILSKKIDQYFQQKSHDLNDPNNSFNPRIIFNDSNVPSEGEHKILQYLKTQPKEYNCLIYGLDSDLIMLSMCAQHDHIALIRENVLIQNNNIDIALDHFPQLNFLPISPLNHIVCSLLDSKDQDQFREIKDYVFMSFFLGNDFLPSCSTLKIRNGGIDRIIQAYKNIKVGDLINHFYPDDHLSFHFLIKFIRELAQHETSSMINLYQRQRLIENESLPPQTFEQALNQYQCIDNQWEDDIDATHSGWERRYYRHFFHLPIGLIDNDYRMHLREICRKYLMTLEWNAQYYFSSCRDWKWLYPYEATPLLSDFLNFLTTEEMIPTIFPIRDPVPPFHQLLMILPPQSASLLPQPYRALMTEDDSPLIHYFPIHVDLDFYGHRYRWETHPKIPFINPLEVESLVAPNESQLTIEECNRGRCGEPITYER